MERPIASAGGFQISLGFLLNMFVSIVAVVVAFSTLRSDTFAALSQIQKQEQVIAQQGELIISMRLKLQELNDSIVSFQKQYDSDMNKYIREPHR